MHIINEIIDSILEMLNKQQDQLGEKEIINYLDINFFEWRNNPILKSTFMKKENSYIWYAHKMYRYGYIDLYLKLYKFFNK